MAKEGMITPQPLMGRINRISRCFTLYRNNQLEQEGLNGYQHLYILWVCRRPGISQEQLVKEIYVHKSSVARQLALREQNGFITRSACPSDRRQLLVYPTEKALRVLPLVREVIGRWNACLLEGFSLDEKACLLAMLERLEEKAEGIVNGEAAGKGEVEQP